ncbi:hypothetical protein HDV57DRAFT_233527 [Trichoderma longibrachiatum]|uniref:Uncharacterized protein n=1 Tax=Trichoderma longibrachiatum ATCC 18648 TaxID=983965 RepID=A0A2T4BQS7_TRILO|nr:hypothetical protein M440DRAFT_207634 [Trichoderma longibrachiatum ATCC 18648]
MGWSDRLLLIGHLFGARPLERGPSDELQGAFKRQTGELLAELYLRQASNTCILDTCGHKQVASGGVVAAALHWLDAGCYLLQVGGFVQFVFIMRIVLRLYLSWVSGGIPTQCVELYFVYSRIAQQALDGCVILHMYNLPLANPAVVPPRDPWPRASPAQPRQCSSNDPR